MSEASVVVVGGRAAVLSSLCSLRVALPSGEAYWSGRRRGVTARSLRPTRFCATFLRRGSDGVDDQALRGRAGAVSGLGGRVGRDLERAARELSRFVLLLRTTPITRRGSGYGRLRSAGRINHALAVVREFVKHQVAQGQLDARVLAALYEVGDDRYLPAELRAEDGQRQGAQPAAARPDSGSRTAPGGAAAPPGRRRAGRVH